jgi:predicted enzyme related to lactoylglutathione lyase
MNSVVHFEIPATDLQRARAFYQEVFDWQMHDFDPNNIMVATVETNEKGEPQKPGAINGGMYKPDTPKTPTIVINVPDIKAHIEKLTAHGGVLVDDIVTIGDMGMYCRFKDTEGNLVALWQTLTK